MAYPSLENIKDNVTIGYNALISADTESTTKLFPVNGDYRRKAEPVNTNLVELN